MGKSTRSEEYSGDVVLVRTNSQKLLGVFAILVRAECLIRGLQADQQHRNLGYAVVYPLATGLLTMVFFRERGLTADE